MKNKKRLASILIYFGYIFTTTCTNLRLASAADLPSEKKYRAGGSLYGDVYNWADMIQNYIQQLAYDGIGRDKTQDLFDGAKYNIEEDQIDTRKVRDQLDNYFTSKTMAAHAIAAAAVQAHDDALDRPEMLNYTNLKQLAEAHYYRDSDISGHLEHMKNPASSFMHFFKQSVALNYSTVKIADEVPRDLNETIFAVRWTHHLEDVFKANRAKDPAIRWQYFGSSAGITRLYPGREWSSNFVGFYNDYDPRIRPWYIAATSGPKDVVIVIDCSLSMHGEKLGIAKAVAKAIIRTLTKQDYLNVVCARASHWDEVGKWHPHVSEVQSCEKRRLVPATIAHQKDLMEKVDEIVAAGTSELEHGFEKAFQLLSGSSTRTDCHSVIVFVTDGKDTDGETVRCGPGYYTRSGYVPGPVCKYNWTKVWDLVQDLNRLRRYTTQARIFSYLIKDEGQHFPGKLACDSGGSIRKLNTGENLISQMSNYFDYLSKINKKSDAQWTSPYLDEFGLGLMVTYAVPVISRKTGQTIGVAAVDATLEEIETSLTRYEWGSVTSFLIDHDGQVIYHPLLKSSTTLKDDPIFIPITKLEQDSKGHPEGFSDVYNAMIQPGSMGTIRVVDGRRGTPKGDFRAGVKYDIMPLEYNYASLNNSKYAFAYVLSDTDKKHRKLQEPKVTLDSPEKKSYFNLLIEYNSPAVLEEYPDVYKYLDVKFNESKYPLLRVAYGHSSIFFAPKCHCDPLNYFFDDKLDLKTLSAHRYMNDENFTTECSDVNSNAKYEKDTRAYVLVTRPIEDFWKNRNFEGIDDVTWTYVGMRTGVFRTFPGHRSTRMYDCTQRPWYRRTMASPTKISISTPYMDSAGSGKIITISQAVFEGMQSQTREYCDQFQTPTGESGTKTGTYTGKKKPGGCNCVSPNECISDRCYMSTGPGPLRSDPRCATERIEAITSLDIGYDTFHRKLFFIMQASDGIKSCDAEYTCPDGSPGCRTKCYLFDDRANVIIASDFITATALNTGAYSVQLGQKEAEVMKELIYKRHFFQRTETLDFQGSCSFSSSAPKVTLKGIPTTPEEQDNLYKDRGPIPAFSNSYGCIQDVVSFTANDSNLGRSRMLVGNVSGPCAEGFYYVTSLGETNLFLLVLEDWKDRSKSSDFNFNCQLIRKVVASGAYRIINGTCAHEDNQETTLRARGRCPAKHKTLLQCSYQAAPTIELRTAAGFSLIIICTTIATVIFNHQKHALPNKDL